MHRIQHMTVVITWQRNDQRERLLKLVTVYYSCPFYYSLEKCSVIIKNIPAFSILTFRTDLEFVTSTIWGTYPFLVIKRGFSLSKQNRSTTKNPLSWVRPKIRYGDSASDMLAPARGASRSDNTRPFRVPSLWAGHIDFLPSAKYIMKVGIFTKMY